MGLKLQGEIFKFPLRDFAKKQDIYISPRLISSVKLLWVSLANFQNEKTGQCNPSISTLSKCIEKSESQTTVCMNELKKLGLVSVSRNAKGGRYTPHYLLHLPSYPMDKGVSSPNDDAPENLSKTTPITNAYIEPYVQDACPIADRTRILIEPLDEPLIKSLAHESNKLKKSEVLIKLGHKYGFNFQPNSPLHELETWLVGLLDETIT